MTSSRRRTAATVAAAVLLAVGIGRGIPVLYASTPIQCVSDPFGPGCPAVSLRYNEVAQKGSHNSYERQESLVDQLTWHRVRSLELDLHNRDETGFHNAVPGHWAVYHGTSLPPPFTDEGDSNCRRLSACLDEIAAFAHSVPNHEVITLKLDLKLNKSGGSYWPATSVHDEAALNALLQKRFGSALYTPDEMRAECGEAASLAAAVHACGWPLLTALRGKVIVLFTGGGAAEYESAPVSQLVFAAHDAGCKDVTATGRLSNAALADPNRVFYSIDTELSCTTPATPVSVATAVQQAAFVGYSWPHDGTTEISNDDNNTWTAMRDAGTQIVSTDKINEQIDPWATTASFYGYPFTPLDPSIDTSYAEETSPTVLGYAVPDPSTFVADTLNTGFTYEQEDVANAVSWVASVSNANSHQQLDPVLGPDVMDPLGCLMARHGNPTVGKPSLPTERFFAVCRTDMDGIAVMYRTKKGGSITVKPLSAAAAKFVNVDDVTYLRLDVSPYDPILDETCVSGWGALSGDYQSPTTVPWQKIGATVCIRSGLGDEGIAVGPGADPGGLSYFTSMQKTQNGGAATTYQSSTFTHLVGYGVEFYFWDNFLDPNANNLAFSTACPTALMPPTGPTTHEVSRSPGRATSSNASSSSARLRRGTSRVCRALTRTARRESKKVVGLASGKT